MNGMEDSPPPFINFRQPATSTSEPARATYNVYDTALQLVSAVHAVVETEPGHYAMKKQLEHHAVRLVMVLARLRTEPHRQSWRGYRSAHSLAVDFAAMFDIVAAQGGTSDAIEAARTIAKRLVAELSPLGLWTS